MKTLDLLAAMFQARKTLATKIMYMAPSSDADELVLHDLIQKREQLSMTIAQLAQADVRATVETIDAATVKLNALAKQLTDLGTTIENAKTAISIVAEIISLTASLVSAAA